MKKKAKRTKKASSRKGSPRVPVFQYEASRIVAHASRAQWGHCYESAFRAFFRFPKNFFPSGTFIEGWAVFETDDDVVLLEHGWLVSNTGDLIDPTMVLVLDHDDPITHFPGVARGWTEMECLEHEWFPHVQFETYGSDGMGHPAYKAAYEAACRHAQARVERTGKRLHEVRAALVEDAPSKEHEQEEIEIAIVDLSSLLHGAFHE
jgi:hypothetical protein